MTEPSRRFAPSPPLKAGALEPLRGEPELGALLRRANEHYASGLDEAAAYRHIEEQLTPPSARGRHGARRATAFLGALGLALAGALVWLKASGDAGTSIVLGPDEHSGARATLSSGERAPGERALGEAALGEAALGEAALAPRDAPSSTLLRPEPRSAPGPEPRSELVRPSRDKEPRKATPNLGSTSTTNGAAVAEAVVKPDAMARGPELDCMQMARDGAPREAEACFVTLASGAGLRAEMALHELARLRRDVLGDASGALAALSEYRQRFARGSLRHEVALSRVDLLVRLGRARDALRESEELLTSPEGRARAAELHVLRGNMYRSALSDLNAAAAEFARAERLGGALGAEATYLRGTCLEALGDGRAALEAYERYMSTPRRPRASEVLRRIAALTAATRAGSHAGSDQPRRPQAR